jgi:hypothetical protein
VHLAIRNKEIRALPSETLLRFRAQAGDVVKALIKLSEETTDEEMRVETELMLGDIITDLHLIHETLQERWKTEPLN